MMTEQQYAELSASLGDFVESLREATWDIDNDMLLVTAHAAFCAGDNESLGFALAYIIKRQMLKTAERMVG